MSATPTLQQPVRSNVTRIATSADVRDASLAIIGCLNKMTATIRSQHAATDERLTRIEAKLDRIIDIMQAASCAATSTQPRTTT